MHHGKRLLHGLGIGVLAVLAAVVPWSLGWLDSAESRTYDWRARLLAQPSPNSERISLILLDQNSLDWAHSEHGLVWPWPREMYAVATAFCERAGARVLAFDVLFTEPSTYGVSDDQRFGHALHSQGVGVLPVFLGNRTGKARRWPQNAPDGIGIHGLDAWLQDEAIADSLTFPRAAFPPPEILTGARLLANVASQPDDDGVYRRIPLFARFDGVTVPSLALAAYLAAANGASLSVQDGAFSLNDSRTQLDGAGRAIVNFRQPGSYPVYSAAQIIRSELLLREGAEPTINPAELAGDSVFFGFVAPGLFDLRPSPVSGVNSGTQIHAAVLDNLLAGDFIAPSPGWLTLVLLVALPLAAALLTFLTPAGNAVVALAAVAFPSVLAGAGYAMGVWLPLVGPSLGVVTASLASLAMLHATEGRQKRFIRSAFGRYLSPAVIELLIRHPERMRLGGERRVLSILFSDIEKFTAISEGLDPEQLTEFLNLYLSAMTDIILDEGGTLDKYEGDAIIAFWNAPLDQPDHATRCLRAAMRCQERLAAMRPALKERVGHDVRMRIGVNTGPAVVGNLGSDARFDYSMIGDAVNVASRLEGANKEFGTYTMVSEETVAASGHPFPTRLLAQVTVVGRSTPLLVYELLPEAAYSEVQTTLETFDEGRRLYCRGELEAALERFARHERTDPPSAAYAVQCRTLLAGQGLPKDWCGTWDLIRK